MCTGAYWDVRIILMPLLLLNMSFCGILQVPLQVCMVFLYKIVG